MQLYYILDYFFFINLLTYACDNYVATKIFVIWKPLTGLIELIHIRISTAQLDLSLYKFLL